MSHRASREGGVARNTPQPDESIANTNNKKSRRTVTFSTTRFSRIQEKHKLQNLNNRFAAYIDNVKYLENKNSKLIHELYSSQEITTREASNIKILLESQLVDLRNALDREAIEKSRLELEVEELKTKFDNATKELKEATPYIARFNELNSKFCQTLINNKNLKDANKVLKQQLNDTISRHTNNMTEVDGHLTKEYEDKLQSELQIIRQAEDVKRNENEISVLFDSKLQHFENELQLKKKALESAQEVINASNFRASELTQLIYNALSVNCDLLTKITDLVRLKESQRIKYIAEIQRFDQQLTAMQKDMSQKVPEYQDLMDIKVALDMEISAYQKLLECEERRLSITPNSSVDESSPRGKKRKLFQRDETEYEFSNVITASSTGDVEISEVCPDGQFVKLYNKGSKVNSSTASNQIHERSAGSIVMNTQAWVVGDLMATILLNPDGQEVATHELKKGQVSHSRANERCADYESELFHQPEVATHELKKGQVSHSQANEGCADYESELFHQPEVATHELKKGQVSHSQANEGCADYESELFHQPEVATHELKKGQVSHSQANEGCADYESELFHQPGDPQTGNKCAIM